MVESFAWQMMPSEAVARPEYRRSIPTVPQTGTSLNCAQGRQRSQSDWWDMADGDWGAGFFQNPACDACDDVVAETADMSFGDAWVEPYASDGAAPTSWSCARPHAGMIGAA